MPKAGEDKSDEDIRKEVAKLIKDAKKEPKFGLSLAKKMGDNPVILTSRVKGAETLEKKARKETGNAKSARGRLMFTGGKLFFRCEEDPPAGCIRHLKLYFKTYGSSAKVALVLPDGRVDNGDDDESSDNAQQVEVLKVFQGLEAKLAPKFSGNPALEAEVNRLTDAMRTIMAADTFDNFAAVNVLKSMAELQKKVPDVPSRAGRGAPPSAAAEAKRQADQAAAQAKLQERFKKVLPALKSVLARDPSLKTPITTIVLQYRDAAKKSPPDIKDMQTATRAGQALLKQFVEQAKINTANIKKSSEYWVSGFESAVSEIEKLKAAIKKECVGLPGSDKLDKAFARFDKNFEELKTSLSDAMKEDAPKGVVANTAEKAQKIQKKLQSDRVWSRLDDNPFVKTSAVKTLDAALSQIQMELAA